MLRQAILRLCIVAPFILVVAGWKPAPNEVFSNNKQVENLVMFYVSQFGPYLKFEVKPDRLIWYDSGMNEPNESIHCGVNLLKDMPEDFLTDKPDSLYSMLGVGGYIFELQFNDGSTIKVGSFDQSFSDAGEDLILTLAKLGKKRIDAKAFCEPKP